MGRVFWREEAERECGMCAAVTMESERGCAGEGAGWREDDAERGVALRAGE